jgi:hypothetical protein
VTYSTDITALRNRMATGEPIEGDLEWCKRRLSVLEDWPDQLSLEQHKEVSQLRAWLLEWAE